MGYLPQFLSDVKTEATWMPNWGRFCDSDMVACLTASELSVRAAANCPHCFASIGEPCISQNGQPRAVHRRRTKVIGKLRRGLMQPEVVPGMCRRCRGTGSMRGPSKPCMVCCGGRVRGVL